MMRSAIILILLVIPACSLPSRKLTTNQPATRVSLQPLELRWSAYAIGDESTTISTDGQLVSVDVLDQSYQRNGIRFVHIHTVRRATRLTDFDVRELDTLLRAWNALTTPQDSLSVPDGPVVRIRYAGRDVTCDGEHPEELKRLVERVRELSTQATIVSDTLVTK